MSGGPKESVVKVKIIDTHYVEADATSFKSVVQMLTGKDSDSDSASSGVQKSTKSSYARGGSRGIRGCGRKD